MEFLPDGWHAGACESGETMQRRPRRNHTPAFKAKGALAAIKGDRTLAQLAEQFDVHANQITAWKAQLESGAADVFGPGGGQAVMPAMWQGGGCVRLGRAHGDQGRSVFS